jgi:hypothetical protein
MSIYSGFATRQKEIGYNQSIFVLIREMASHIVDLKKKLANLEKIPEKYDNSFEK